MAELVDKLYSQNGVIVRKAEAEDVLFLSDKLRKSDVDEIWASSNKNPYEGLKESFSESTYCCTILIEDKPVGMFGIAPEVVLGNKASIWFLASEDINKIGRRFVKNSKRFINQMLGYYGCLYNFVDDRNKASIKWLKLCGAIMEEPKPYGKEQLPFRYFYFKREVKDV